MLNYVLINSLLITSSLSTCLCMYLGNEESLREDILKLFQGNLKFSDDEIPRFEEELPDITPKNHSAYDFVVIGAGTAGATIASRLSEVENVTVLLIEAGSKEYPIMDIPAMAAALQFTEQTNWNYTTEKSDRHCRGLKNSQCLFPRGKVMGGSSVLNFMIATRGSRRDFDEWAKSTGDNSWSYSEILKYFKKLENFQINHVDVEDEFHGKNGPVYVTSPVYTSELSKTLLAAGRELGFSNADYNGRSQLTFSYLQSTIKDGERWSTNRAYLHPARGRKNLFLSRNSHVNKILIDEVTKTAFGVQFSKDDQIFEVRARKEVILSAGAINSPQILMLSGIGPADHLRELEINIVKDAPVGENLIDHLAYIGLIFNFNDTEVTQQYGLDDPRNPAIREYLTNRTGVLTLASLEIMNYINTDDPNPFNGDPTMEFILGDGSLLQNPAFLQALGVDEEYQNKIIANSGKHNSWSVVPVIMKPKSRGKILLRSADPKDKPRIYPNYLSHPDDVKTFISGIRFCFNISDTKTLQKRGSKLHDMPLPCKSHEFNSDDYWECAIRTFGISMYHQSGTCKMGSNDDDTAVIDSKLKVIGIKGLRVVDASIMPTIVSAHTNVPVIAIAEKAADEIKNDYGYN